MQGKKGRRKSIRIAVCNRLVRDRRDINVYHHSEGTNNIISSKSRAVYSLGDHDAGDCLKISVPSGPGYLLNPCILEMPPYMNYRFSAEGKFLLLHKGERTLLKIPPGPPLWELKLFIPVPMGPGFSVSEDQVIISDEANGTFDEETGEVQLT